MSTRAVLADSDPTHGYVLECPGGWLTYEGRVTDRWQERGVWPTLAKAQVALDKFVREGRVA